MNKKCVSGVRDMCEHDYQVPFDWEERSKWLELFIPINEYKERISKLQRLMKKDKIDAMLVYGGNSEKSNLQYISGFDCWVGKRGDSMVFIPPEGDDLIFITNALYHGEPAHSNMHLLWIKDIRLAYCPGSPKKEQKSMEYVAQIVADIIKSKGIATGRIALCNPMKIPSYLMEHINNNLPSADFISGTSYLQELRLIKSPAEVALFKKACECTDEGINKAFEKIHLGITERELYSIIANEAFTRGTHSFKASVNFGPRSSIKNNFIPGDYSLKEGEIVSMDVLSCVAGYCTDTHRNAMIGKPEDNLSIRLMDTVLEVGQKVLEKVSPGAVIYDLQKIMYDYIEKAGLLAYDYTKKLFAHGCGLDSVEPPLFFWGNKDTLKPGMTFYLEPFLVKHDMGTACWENLVLITENGHEVLSKAKDRSW